MHAPATAQVVTDLVRSGETSIVHLAPFRRDRFDDGEAREESRVI
jgi:glycine/D-amino acid oxidase-like deaminating enzyme